MSVVRLVAFGSRVLQPAHRHAEGRHQGDDRVRARGDQLARVVRRQLVRQHVRQRREGVQLARRPRRQQRQKRLDRRPPRLRTARALLRLRSALNVTDGTKLIGGKPTTAWITMCQTTSPCQQ